MTDNRSGHEFILCREKTCSYNGRAALSFVSFFDNNKKAVKKLTAYILSVCDRVRRVFLRVSHHAHHCGMHQLLSENDRAKL